MIVRPVALAGRLRRAPSRPSSAALLLESQAAMVDFRQIVLELFPEVVAHAILTAAAPGLDRMSARLQAFTTEFTQRYFPLEALEEYEQLQAGIPFPRLGWSLDDLQD